MDQTQLIEQLEIALKEKQIIQLESLLEQASTEYTEAAFTYYFKGEYQLLLSDPMTATAFFEKAVEIESSYKYKLSLAYTKLQINKDEEAKIIFDQLLAEKPEDADLLFAVAMYHSGQMDDEQAIEYLNKALDVNPHLVDAREMRAFLFKMKEQQEAALLDYNYLIEADPTNPSLRFQRIELLKEQKNREAILADYNALIENDPEDVEYRIGLGEYYVSIGEFKEAEYCFSDVLDIEQSKGIISAHSYKKRGIALLRQGDYYKALVDFKVAMKLEEEDAEGYVLTAQTLQALNKNAQAINYLNIGLDLCFDMRWLLYERLGSMSLEAEQWLEAEKAFEGMTRDLAGKAEGYYQLGLLYVRQGDLESAFGAFKEADDNLHENAAEMMKLHCADFIAADKRAAELELMAEYEDAFVENAASVCLKPVFGKLWKLDGKLTASSNPLLKTLPDEMKKMLIDTFKTMLVQLSPQGLLIYNFKKDDTRALYRIEKENAAEVEVATQPFGSGQTATLTFKTTAENFVLCGIGEEGATLDLYFKEGKIDSLPNAIKADFSAKKAAGKMEFLGTNN